MRRTTLESMTFKIFQDFRCWKNSEFFWKYEHKFDGRDLILLYRKHLQKISTIPLDEVVQLAEATDSEEGRRDYVRTLFTDDHCVDDGNSTQLP